MTHWQFAVIDPFSVGQGPPPSYEASVEQNPDLQSDTNLMLRQKIADLEATIQKNSQEMHRMQQEVAASFQKQLDALMDMQQQFQTQLTQLQLVPSVQNLQ